MITKINNAQDAIQAFNENLEGLLTGKRKPNIVKEVNNTVGKLTNVVRMELMEKAITGDRRRHTWFNMPKEEQIIQIPKDSKIGLTGKQLVETMKGKKGAATTDKRKGG